MEAEQLMIPSVGPVKGMAVFVQRMKEIGRVNSSVQSYTNTYNDS
jgi:hypothetical protein